MSAARARRPSTTPRTIAVVRFLPFVVFAAATAAAADDEAAAASAVFDAGCEEVVSSVDVMVEVAEDVVKVDELVEDA